MDATILETLYDGPEVEPVLSRSALQWQTAFLRAKSMSQIPQASLDLTRCLGRIPLLPNDIGKYSQWIEGYSTWNNEDASCPLRIRTERTMRIHLRKLYPTICTVSSSPNFRTWESKPNNGIALLILGWAYILSAALAERQGLSMEYSAQPDTAPSASALHLDYAFPGELRWWKALVAPGVGWSIAGGQVAPWALSVQEMEIEVQGEVESGKRPPTAREAACYLERFCQAHHLGNQSSAALAAALSIPLHASTALLKPARIELPRPSFAAHIGCPGLPDSSTDFELIGYYMTLSLSPWALGPFLWSVFWDPDVPCNLAGAWMAPIATVLEPIIGNNDLELLARVLSFTNVAPLWLGIALCGRRTIINSILPSLTELRDYPYFRPSIDAAAWTGVDQSFMDYQRTRPGIDGMVSRADVWRLRHDCYEQYPGVGFLHTPPHGWPPFGRMRATDVELEIRHHLACSHEWNYAYWTWSLCDLADAGFSMTEVLSNRDLEESRASVVQVGHTRTNHGRFIRGISERATRAVFWWCCEQVEKGFGGTIVPCQFGADEPLESTESTRHDEAKFIIRWLETLVT